MPVMATFFASILTGRGGAESHEKRKYHDVLAQTKKTHTALLIKEASEDP
jgi:hypothetical protein